MHLQQHLDRIHFWKTHFEAYLRRNTEIQKYYKTNEVKKLHLGCGSYEIESWLNTDLYGNDKIVPVNLMKKLPFKSSVFDYIFLEHVIEHFTYTDGQKILEELFRILKPGGTVRIATPNLQFLVNLYAFPEKKLYKKYISKAEGTYIDSFQKKAAFVVNNFFHDWGHKFIYDYETLKMLLAEVGFTDFTQCKNSKSKNSNLRNLEQHWKIMGKDLNDLETFVIEAVK